MGAHNYEDPGDAQEAVKRLKAEIKRLKFLLELQAMKVRALEEAAKPKDPSSSKPPSDDHPTLPFPES